MYKTYYSKKFLKQYSKLPQLTQKKFDKQITLLLQDLRHPSIRAKKEQSKKDIWEGRIDRFYRFTFEILEDELTLRTIGPHDEALS